MFDNQKSGSGWVWILPIAMLALSVNAFININADNVTAQLVVWSCFALWVSVSVCMRYVASAVH